MVAGFASLFLPLAHPALFLGDVDVLGHGLAVALDDDGDGAVQFLHDAGHVGEVGHRGVVDLEHDITGPDPGQSGRPVAGALLEFALLDFACRTGRLADDRGGRAGSAVPR